MKTLFTRQGMIRVPVISTLLLMVLVGFTNAAPVPATPVATAATSMTINSFIAHWGAVSGATEYRIDVSTDPGFAVGTMVHNNALVSSFTGSTTTSVPIYYGLTAGIHYWYRIRAVNASGASGNSNVIDVWTLPVAPVAVAATAQTSTGFTANWNAVAGATEYRLDVSLNSSFSSFVSGYQDVLVSGLFKVVSALSPNVPYYYRVRAKNVSGASANSNTKAVLTDWLTFPNGGDVLTIGSSITVVYNTSVYTPSTVSVELYKGGVKVYPTGGSPPIGNSIPTTGLTAGTDYKVRVWDLSNGIMEDYSNNFFEIAVDANYVRTTLPLTSGNTTDASIVNLANANKIISSDFLDGLGRPMQNVVFQGSASLKDIVVPMSYDAYGRESIKYLPYASNYRQGFYKQAAIADQDAYYQPPGSSSSIASDNDPYAISVLEASPIERIIEQGAPGSNWQPGVHGIKYSYETNASGEVLKWTYVPPSASYPLGVVSSTATTTYETGKLFKTKITDEHNNNTFIFTDFQGHVILRQVQYDANNYTSTYYIYNDQNNLVCILPPEAIRGILAAPSEYFGQSDANKDIFLSKWAFRYRYDERNRLIIKQTPGVGSVFTIYDGRDRAVLTQDAVQRSLPIKEWTFTKYDLLNRVVLSGKFVSSNDIFTMQTAVDTYYSSLGSNSGAWFESYVGSQGGNVLGYDNKSFPTTVSASDYYTAAYFDKYDGYLASAGYTYLNQSLTGQETTNNTRITGMQIGSQVKNLATGIWLKTIIYYDAKYRVIQTIADHHKGTSGTIRTSNVLDFTGRTSISQRVYTVNTVTTVVKETFTYDHLGRVLTIKNSVNGGTDVMIVKNSFNEIGQLVEKNLHSTDNGLSFEQSIDQRYNIRGWLKSINNSQLTNDGSLNDDSNDYFGMELGFENSIGSGNTSLYNGNISGVKWSQNLALGMVKNVAFNYTYDPMSRIKAAGYFENNSGIWSGTGKYSESGYDYDQNGNIKSLTRKDAAGLNLDVLTYDYSNAGNQLLKVSDTGDKNRGFIDGSNAGNDYAYDANGNLVSDLNKGLTASNAIQYNYLSLPSIITKGTEILTFNYDATGRKLSQLVNSSSKLTDYIGELVYENGVLQFITHSEGRIVMRDTPSTPEYQYYIKDHLGNIRLTFTTKSVQDVYSATFDNPTNEQPLFSNYTRTNLDLFDHTDAGTTYTYAQMKNGSAGNQVGIAKSIAVMPGDIITAEVYAKYWNVTSANNDLSGFAAAVLTSFGLPAPVSGEHAASNGVSSGVTYLSPHTGGSGSAPKAYINFMTFDSEYNLVPGNTSFSQLDAAFSQPTGTSVKAPHYLMTVSQTIKQPGFVYIYVSNESSTNVDVYFDDFKITHTKSKVVEQNDYYPFGLAFNAGKRESNVNVRFQYNGKEKIDDLNLGVFDYGFRLYDPAIGRWSNPDKLADLGASLTPFRYCFNNPLNYTDPLGLWERGANGNYMTSDINDIDRMLTYLSIEKTILCNNPTIRQINQFIDGEESPAGLGALSNGAKLVSTITVHVFSSKHRDEWYIDKKSFDNAWHEVQGSLTPDALDPRTIGQNLPGMSYAGGNNPRRYDGTYDYSYVPESWADYPAIGHDRRYDNLKAAGLSDLILDTRVIGADWRFVGEELAIASLPIGFKTRTQAYGLGILLGAAATSKTLVKISQPNAIVDIMFWYYLSDDGVSNLPEK